MKKCKKIPHLTTYGAANHINHLRKRKGNENKEFGVYFHADCNAYHVSSSNMKGCLIKTK
jgi:hypothetical protein